MWQDFKLFHKGLVLVSVLIVVEFGFVGMLWKLLQDAANTAAKESFYSSISGRTSQIFESSFEVHANLLCYVWGAGSHYATRVRESLQQIDKDYDALQILLKDNPDYIAKLNHCRQLTQEALPMTNQILQLVASGRTEQALSLFDSADFAARKQPVLAALYEFISEQQPLIDENVLATVQANGVVKNWIYIGIAINILLAIFAFNTLVRKITQRIDVVLDNTRLLAADKPLKAPLKGKDEVGELDHVFHHMANVLAEARQREQAMIENACDVICSIDRSGKFLRVSPAASTVWGTEPARLVNESIAKLMTPSEFSEIISSIDKMQLHHTDVSFESSVKHGVTGALLNMLWSAHWSDREQCIFCVVHDVTARKKAEALLKSSEQRISTILENTGVGLLSVLEDGHIEQVNSSARHLFQCERKDLEGHNLDDLFEQTAVGANYTLLSLLQRQPVVETNAILKTGKLLPVEVSIGKTRVGDSKQFLVNILDITERRQLEQMKREFVSTISDNLRLPLDSVEQFLRRVCEKPEYHAGLKERGIQGASLAKRNIGRLLRLTNDLVDVATFKSGTLTLEPCRCDLAGILERSVDAVGVFAEKHSIAVEFQHHPCDLYADQDRIERVLVNLLSNAVKFSPAGSKVSILTAERETFVIISVIDQGRGIPPTHINSIFESFRQVSDTDATQKGGTGLGLAICKAIVEQHGGQIGVESEEGRGSKFWFTVPKETEVTADLIHG